LKKGEGEWGNASLFFSTTATDLVARKPGLLSGIKSTLDVGSGIPERTLKNKFNKLILQPHLGIQ
ncbi:hypothetical protein GQ43DRAFT_381192, partial [Delitschia confertaspora ATCC 74209]